MPGSTRARPWAQSTAQEAGQWASMRGGRRYRRDGTSRDVVPLSSLPGLQRHQTGCQCARLTPHCPHLPEWLPESCRAAAPSGL